MLKYQLMIVFVSILSTTTGSGWNTLKSLNRGIATKVSDKTETQISNVAQDISPQIVGGYDARRNEAPWQAGLNIDNLYFCGGYLIHECWVVTAGHCVIDFHEWLVRLGMYEYKLLSEVGRQVFKSNTAILHEEYNDTNVYNDIALIYLGPNRCAKRNAYVNIVNLPPKNYWKKSLEGVDAKVCGWGTTSDDGVGDTRYLKCVNTTVISNKSCKNFYKGMTTDFIITSKTICTFRPGSGGESCYGDSGGAYVMYKDDKWYAIGIVSTGGTCSSTPAVNTRITKYIYWIRRKIRNHDSSSYAEDYSY